MRINRLIIVFTMLFPFFSYTQYDISGKVVDDSRKPVEYANVILLSPIDSIFIKGTITNAEGIFLLENVKGGRYELKVSFLGFKPWKKTFVLNENFNFGTIQLAENLQALEGVVVTAREGLIERKIDRTVFNVSKSVVAIGGDGLDVLRVAPGVRITGSDVQIIGKGSVKVMINERLLHMSGPELANYLRSLQAENIDKIEIITAPPAKYDAEGNAGLINIITKKKIRNGWYGSITGRISKNSRFSEGISSNFNFNTNKLNTHFTLGYSNSAAGGYYLQNVYYPNNTFYQLNESSIERSGYYGRIDASYNLSTKTTAGINIRYNSGKTNRNRNDWSKFLSSHIIDSILITESFDHYEPRSNVFAFYLDHELDSLGSQINFETSYFNYQKDRDYRFLSQSYDDMGDLIGTKEPVLSTNNREIQLFYARLDINLNNDFAQFDFGAKASFSNTDNNSIYGNTDNIITQNSHFIYDENVYAAYVSAEKKMNKWTFKTGLRAEYTYTKGNSLTLNRINKNNYIKLFPTAYVMYDLNKDHTFSASYSKRIDRPGYNSLDPFREYHSTFAYSEGNPLLEPSYSHNFEAVHNYKNKFSTSLYLNYITNGYDYITLANPETLVIGTIQKNFLTNYTYGVNENISLSPLDWLETSAQLYAYYSEVFSDNPNTREYLEGYGAYAYVNNNIIIDKKKSVRANISFWYQFPEIWGVDEMEAYYSLNLGISAKFFKNKLTLAANVRDILKTRKQGWSSLINNIPQYFFQYNDTRNFRFSATYNFGSSENKRKSRRIKDENINRIN